MTWNPNFPNGAPAGGNLNYMGMLNYGGPAPSYLNPQAAVAPPSQFLATNPYPNTSWAQQPVPQQMQFPMAANGGDLGQMFDSTAIAMPTSFNLPNDEPFQGVVGATPGQGMWSDFSEWMRTSGMLGSTDKFGKRTDGWGGLAMDAAKGIGSAFMGMQQYKLAKQTLQSNKDQFNKNFDAQKGLTNSALEDRQKRRNRENSNSTPVEEYMSKYGVK